MLEIAWRKSSLCDGGGCVEVAATGGTGAGGKEEGGVIFLMRNSKDPKGPVLRFTSEEWADFVASTKEGSGLPY
jgi:Domain of unknown function (DUF397)